MTLVSLDTSRRSRNLKSLIKSIKPIVIDNNRYAYIVKTCNETLLVVSPCKPVEKIVKVRRFDKLSGLTQYFREYMVKTCNTELFRIYWDGEYYRVRINLTSNTNLVIISIGDEREEEVLEAIRGEYLV